MVVLVQMKERRWENEGAALTPPQPLCLFLLILQKIFFAFCDVVSMRFIDLLEQLSSVIYLNIFSFSNMGACRKWILRIFS